MDREYMGYKVEVTHDMRFRVQFGEGEDSYVFASYAEAKTAIEKAAKAAGMKVSLPVVTAEGGDGVIDSINRTGSSVKGQGFETRQYSRSTRGLYPPVDWVRQAIAERRRRQAEIDALDEVLNQVSISVSRGYGRVEMSELPDKLAELSKEYEDRSTKAQLEPVDVVKLLEGVKITDEAC